MPRKNSKVIRYRRPWNINVGMIIFLVFFIYMIYNIGAYFIRQRVQVYEVGQISSVVKDTTYSGLILREETCYITDRAGYVNYYVKASSRTGVGNTVYSIDPDGTYNSIMTSSDPDKQSSLTEEQLNTLKSKLTAYSAGYSSAQFHNVYDVKYSVQNLLLNYLSAEALEKIEAMGSNGKFVTVAAEQSGIVEYYRDGYENKTEEDLTSKDFSQTNYKNNPVSSGSQLEKNSFVYKVITSENWVIYLPLTDEDTNRLAEKTKVYLHFNDVNLDAAADFELIQTSDGKVLGKCSLARYMNQLADRRYASVTLMNSRTGSGSINGLKIPKTSVIQKSFYVVPDTFITRGGENSELGFIVENRTKNGITTEFISPEIYAHIGDYYYVSTDSMEKGITLIRPSDTEDMQEAETTQAETTEEETTASEETSASEETMDTEETTEGESESETAEETAAAETEEEEELPPVSPDATSYEVGRTHKLDGALCVNKGYCVFKQITILDEADDYYIVQTNQSYGLAVYDHILLDGTAAKEGDIIYH